MTKKKDLEYFDINRKKALLLIIVIGIVTKNEQKIKMKKINQLQKVNL